MTDAIAGLIKAFDGAAKGAALIQRISHIQNEYESLCDEIEDIRGLVEKTREIDKPSADNETRVSKATKRLEKVVKQLRDIENEVQGRQPDKVGKAQWLAKSRKMERLLESARSARKLLSEAIPFEIWEQTKIMVSKTSLMPSQLSLIAETTIRFETAMVDYNSGTWPRMIRSNEPSRIQELPETDQGDHDVEKADDRTTKAPHQIVEQDHASKTSSDWAMSEFTSMQRAAREEGCQCCCHSKASHFQGSAWVAKVFGSWNISYRGRPTQKHCDTGCGCDSVTVFSADYRLPAWLWSNVLLFNATYGVGGLQCAMRTTRVVPIDSEMWLRLHCSKEAVQDFISEGHIIYPDDRMADNAEIFEDLLSVGEYSTLELLLKMWANVLAEQGISRRVWYRTNWTLANHTLDEGQTNIVLQLNSYARDKVKRDSTLYSAAILGLGVEEAISEAVDINELGTMGLAPLHLAAMTCHFEAVQQLIDAGANVDVRDVEGNTPLIRAAMNRSAECMRRLMLAGCDINLKNDRGEVALHAAARYACLGAVRLLVQKGAKYTCDMYGRAPLHQLAFSTEPARYIDAGEFQEIARLLLAMEHVNIDAADSLENTPVVLALYSHNLPIVRSLFEAGASFNFCHSWGNLLHFAAWFYNAELLRFLATLPLPAVDAHLPDRGGSTPWNDFIMSMHVQPWKLSTHARCPDMEERSAFASLYTSMRNRNIRHDLSLLQQAQGALSAKNSSAAAAHLLSVAKAKAELHNHELASFYRGISQQIKSGYTDTALRSIQGEIQNLTDEILSSPWDNYPRQDLDSTPTTDESYCHKSEPEHGSYQHWATNSSSTANESWDEDENNSEQSMGLVEVPPRARRKSI